ncbi:hypothetical protein AAA438_07695, partial [Lactobacillus crispatus]|uniref:hypothetical protein n=1 Tax=Lactobacillus crispatus TaxID=47770 RepID=UPI0030F5F4B4
MIECSESILTSVDVFVVINILSNRSKWTFYFLQSVQVNFTIGEKIFLNLKQVYREFLPDFIAIYLLEKKV